MLFRGVNRTNETGLLLWSCMRFVPLVMARQLGMSEKALSWDMK
jgi:hypothetical protein